MIKNNFLTLIKHVASVYTSMENDGVSIALSPTSDSKFMEVT